MCARFIVHGCVGKDADTDAVLQILTEKKLPYRLELDAEQNSQPVLVAPGARYEGLQSIRQAFG